MPKWIVGKAISVRDIDGARYLLYEDIPKIQAARCQPVIESAQASVLVDPQTGMVHSYTIDSPTKQIDSAWANVFLGSERVNRNYSGPLNITTSLGVLFLDGILGSADRRTGYGNSGQENLDDNAFVILDRERGINIDLMTSSMYAMANKDPDALLNYTTLVNYADRTIETFFQHFVNSGFSLKNGGYAYQAIDKPGQDLNNPVTLNRTASVLDGNHGIAATTSHRTRVLHMDNVATYLSISILVWLIGTTIIIMCLQRRYFNSMIRDVHLIADMLVLIAGSDNLLELVQEKGITLKRNREIKAMLGWFKDRSGEVRWGVEVVGGRNAVEWVDAPKQGWHVREKTSSAKQWIPYCRK